MAEDIDAGVNGLVEYFLIEGNRGITNEDKLTSADGYGTFAISFPHQGQVTLVKSLDYERIQKYYLTIVASVWHYEILHCEHSFYVPVELY